MKINFITATMSGGGTERVIAILANYFFKKGHEVEIILIADNIVDYELDDGIVINHLTNKTNRNMLARIRRIGNLRMHMKKYKGVYFSFGTETNLFAIVASVFLRTKLILSERSNPYMCNFKILRNIIYSFGKQFVFQTEDARKCFPKRIQHNGRVIPNPISEYIPEFNQCRRKKTVVSVGRLSEEKNHQMLIRAFAEFSVEFAEYQLVIYGKGPLQNKLQEQCKNMGIESKVIFAGFVPNILEHIRDASMYILSSDYEGISNSLLEAMAVGLPVISTDCPIGGSKMLIEHSKNGLLIPVGDEGNLVKAMKQIAGDSEFANNLSLEAIKVGKKYAVDKICKMWEELITNV